jgi:hypothetical protein
MSSVPSENDDILTRFLNWVSTWYNEYWAWGFCLFACVGLPALFWALGLLKGNPQ